MTKEEAIKDIEENILPFVGGKSLRMAIDALRQPERKTGEWVRDGYHIACNQCYTYMCDIDRDGDVYPKNFCPNCGADMREGQDERSD